MPRPYQASLGGLEGSGIYPKAPAAPDWGSIIGALSQGATSLIQNAYLRKIADRNYSLNVMRLNNEMELHKATLEATKAYHEAMLGNQQARIAAPDARKTKANQQAFTDLQSEFPEHHLVAPDAETGEKPSFDPDNQADYVGALRTARDAKAKADAALTAERYKVDNMTKAAQLRQAVQAAGIAQRTGANANKPLSPAEVDKQKKDFLTQLGTLSGGDPQKARDILAADPDVAAAANKFGVKDYEVAAAAGAVQAKADASTSRQAGTIFSSGMAKTPEEAAGMVPRLKVPASGTSPAGTTPAASAGTPGASAPPGTTSYPPMPSGPVPPGGWPATAQGAKAAAPITPLTVPAPAAVAPAPPVKPPMLNLKSISTASSPAAPVAVPASASGAAPVAGATPGPVVAGMPPAPPNPYPTQSAHWDAAANALRAQKMSEADIATKLGPRPKDAVVPSVPTPQVVKPEEDDEE